MGGKSLPGDFIIRSDKKKKKLKQLSIGGSTLCQPDDFMSEKLMHADSASSLRDQQIIEVHIAIRKSKKLAKKKKIVQLEQGLPPKTGIEQAFIRKTPQFIQEAAEYETLNLGICQ